MKVSIIVTVYNIEQYLDKCLQSLIKTGHDVTEIICVDDGSTDSSYSTICEYRKKDQRIIGVHKENGGISSARNTGMQVASGDFLVFIDGDDYIEPDKLNLLLDRYKEQLDSDVMSTVWCGYIREDWNGKRDIDPIFVKKAYERKDIIEQFFPAILGISYKKLYAWFAGEGLQTNQEFPSVWRAVYSKRIIDKHNITFNESMKTGEDILFNWEYLAYVNNIYVDNIKYYHYIWRKGSLTQNTAEHFYESKKNLVQYRDALNKQLIEVVGDFSEEYQGSLVLSKIQVALALSACSLKNMVSHYKMFSCYARMYPIVEAYKKLQLDSVPLKYKVPLFIAKRQWDLLLFLGCSILAKLKIQIYPED